MHDNRRGWIANLLLIYYLQATCKLRGRNGNYWFLCKINYWLRICQLKERKGIGSDLLPPADSLLIRPVKLVASISQQSEAPDGADQLLPSNEFDVVKPTLT